MSIVLEQLTHILAEAGISSSQEEEILIVAKRFTTPPEEKEESIVEELCTSYEEQLCEQKIEKGKEGMSGDQNHEEYPANKCCIKQCFQVSTNLNQFCFLFYFINLHFQYLVSHIFIHLRLHFVKLDLNFYLVLLHRWLHWQFHFTQMIVNFNQNRVGRFQFSLYYCFFIIFSLELKFCTTNNLKK